MRTFLFFTFLKMIFDVNKTERKRILVRQSWFSFAIEIEFQ